MKNAEPALLLDAIRAVSTGAHWLQPELTGKVVRELRRAREAERGRPHASLTDRETDILKLIADGLRNPEIPQRLFISESTVKTYVANIFSKLQVHDRVAAVRYAIRNRIALA